MPAALLELIPEIGLGVLLLAFVLSYGAGRGLLVMWGATFGRMLLGIAAFLHFSATIAGRGVHFDFGHVFVAANNGVVNWIEAWIRTSEEGMARTLRAMTAVAQAGIRASEWVAKETAQTFDWLVHVHLPRWAKAALFPLLLPFLLPKILHAVLPHVRQVVVKPIHVIERTLPGKVVTIVKTAGAIAIPGAIGLPRVWHGIRDLRHADIRLGKRVKRLEVALGAAAFAGLMANALGVTTRCLRSGNIGRTARALCGLPKHALDDLLGLVIDFLVINDICQVIVLLNDAFALVGDQLAVFAGEVGGALCHGDYDGGPVVQVAAFTVPPLQVQSLLLGT